MTQLIDVLAVMVTAGGVVSGVMVLAAVRDGSLALRVGLEFWMAAGMLRLAAPPSWRTLAGAAGILAVRQVIIYGLRLTRTDR